jgi:hypothetical protein
VHGVDVVKGFIRLTPNPKAITKADQSQLGRLLANTQQRQRLATVCHGKVKTLVVRFAAISGASMQDVKPFFAIAT